MGGNSGAPRGGSAPINTNDKSAFPSLGAWSLEPRAKKSPDDHLSGANLYDKSLQTNDRSKSVCSGGSKMCSRFFENGQLNGTGDSILLPVTLVLSRACVLFSFSRQ